METHAPHTPNLAALQQVLKLGIAQGNGDFAVQLRNLHFPEILQGFQHDDELRGAAADLAGLLA